MLRTYWKKGLGLVLLTATSMLVGGFVLAGLGGHSAFAQIGTVTNGAATAITAGAPAATISEPAISRDVVIDMMKDHMGFTDEQADQQATQMLEHMQAVHGDEAGTMMGGTTGTTGSTSQRTTTGMMGGGGMGSGR
jgi:hypothetical protein